MKTVDAWIDVLSKDRSVSEIDKEEMLRRR
jgi:hypothetical protein